MGRCIRQGIAGLVNEYSYIKQHVETKRQVYSHVANIRKNGILLKEETVSETYE